ncbi:MAG: hypothetical protein K9N09_08000 [Candidatus Cloacimonetes bacterium]|nr:hypothetical protein [Candidatus Cloacimonadota bacterium]MCF7813998.1 hypothetical protein [Candidatus Cloacimonadota bacterium]MCF7868626.1 hypothetical protein [Candidatus Cloacimonadota bacterium]MCF7882855.1 hypothetical protein [Candidatus Cloacimonadota bacterium]
MRIAGRRFPCEGFGTSCFLTFARFYIKLVAGKLVIGELVIGELVIGKLVIGELVIGELVTG